MLKNVIAYHSSQKVSTYHQQFFMMPACMSKESFISTAMYYSQKMAGRHRNDILKPCFSKDFYPFIRNMLFGIELN
jgi:hypothetical protein